MLSYGYYVYQKKYLTSKRGVLATGDIGVSRMAALVEPVSCGVSWK